MSRKRGREQFEGQESGAIVMMTKLEPSSKKQRLFRFFSQLPTDIWESMAVFISMQDWLCLGVCDHALRIKCQQLQRSCNFLSWRWSPSGPRLKQLLEQGSLGKMSHVHSVSLALGDVNFSTSPEVKRSLNFHPSSSLAFPRLISPVTTSSLPSNSEVSTAILGHLPWSQLQLLDITANACHRARLPDTICQALRLSCQSRSLRSLTIQGHRSLDTRGHYCPSAAGSEDAKDWSRIFTDALHVWSHWLTVSPAAAKLRHLCLPVQMVFDNRYIQVLHTQCSNLLSLRAHYTAEPHPQQSTVHCAPSSSSSSQSHPSSSSAEFQHDVFTQVQPHSTEFTCLVDLSKRLLALDVLGDDSVYCPLALVISICSAFAENHYHGDPGGGGGEDSISLSQAEARQLSIDDVHRAEWRNVPSALSIGVDNRRGIMTAAELKELCQALGNLRRRRPIAQIKITFAVQCNSFDRMLLQLGHVTATSPDVVTASSSSSSSSKSPWQSPSGGLVIDKSMYESFWSAYAGLISSVSNIQEERPKRLQAASSSSKNPVVSDSYVSAVSTFPGWHDDRMTFGISQSAEICLRTLLAHCRHGSALHVLETRHCSQALHAAFVCNLQATCRIVDSEFCPNALPLLNVIVPPKPVIKSRLHDICMSPPPSPSALAVSPRRPHRHQQQFGFGRPSQYHDDDDVELVDDDDDDDEDTMDIDAAEDDEVERDEEEGFDIDTGEGDEEEIDDMMYGAPEEFRDDELAL